MEVVATLDIGGTYIRAAAIDKDHKIIKIIKEKTIHNNLNGLLDLVKKMLKNLDLRKYVLKAISIGVAGRVRKMDHIDELPNIGVKDIDFVHPLMDEFNVPVYVLNDAEMAVIAEANISAKNKYERVYFVTISTGLGGALAVNSELANFVKEIGHSAFYYKNKLYDLENLIAGVGISKLAKLNNLEIKDAKEFFDLVRNKNENALTLFNDWLSLLTDFFAFIIKSFAPDVIYVSGGFMKDKDLFLSKLQTRFKNVDIIENMLGDEITLIGAQIYAEINMYEYLI
jgi:glucokinase